jgi:hypothetical protein
MQDGATPHTIKMVLNFLHTPFGHLVSQASQLWELQATCFSPDLNPRDFIVGLHETEVARK